MNAVPLATIWNEIWSRSCFARHERNEVVNRRRNNSVILAEHGPRGLSSTYQGPHWHDQLTQQAHTHTHPHDQSMDNALHYIHPSVVDRPNWARETMKGELHEYRRLLQAWTTPPYVKVQDQHKIAGDGRITRSKEYRQLLKLTASATINITSAVSVCLIVNRNWC